MTQTHIEMSGEVNPVIIPFKDQKSADIVKSQLNDLSVKPKTTIQPVFTNHKIGEEFPMREPKLSFINQSCVVYEFQCDRCDAGYVGYTRRNLFVLIDGHKNKNSSVSILSKIRVSLWFLFLPLY